VMFAKKLLKRKKIKEYLGQIVIACKKGTELILIMEEILGEEPLKNKNVIIYAYLRKTIRLLISTRGLILRGFTEEAQIMARALIETKINFDYFLMIADEDYDKAFQRVFDSIMLDKIKALEAMDCTEHEVPYDESGWSRIKSDIQSRYTEQEFKQLKKYGFSGISVEERTRRTGNKPYYDLVYRMYSRNVHATDTYEQLGYAIGEHFKKYEESRNLALLQAVFNCSVGVIYKVNERLGGPILLP
jgi:hypothetical protein